MCRRTSPTFSRPARKNWLATWLAFDPVDALKRVETPVLLVYGEHDMQVSRKEFSRLVAAKPQAGIRVVPGMNYALKEVRDEDENYAAFPIRPSGYLRFWRICSPPMPRRSQGPRAPALEQLRAFRADQWADWPPGGPRPCRCQDLKA